VNLEGLWIPKRLDVPTYTTRARLLKLVPFVLLHPWSSIVKKILNRGERRRPAFSLKKFVPAFEPVLVTWVSSSPGLKLSNQCNSREVGMG